MDQDLLDEAMAVLVHHIAPRAPFDALEHLEHRLRQCVKYQLHDLSVWERRVSRREVSELVVLLDLPWLLPYPVSRREE